MPLDTAAACGAPTRSAKSSSKRSIAGPSERRPGAQHLEDELLLPLAEVRARERDLRRDSAGRVTLRAASALRDRGVLEPVRPALAAGRDTVSRYAFWSFSVTGPAPISWSSTERSGVTSAAVPTMKTSSAR